MRLPFRHADSGHIDCEVSIVFIVQNIVKGKLCAIDTEHLWPSVDARQLRLACYANSFRSTSRT